MNEPIIAEIGKVENMEELKVSDMEYVKLCIIEGHGLMGAATQANSSYRHFQKIQAKMYTIFDVTSQQGLALALVSNGIIKLK